MKSDNFNQCQTKASDDMLLWPKLEHL